MITSVEETIRDAVQEVFSDWIDADDRLIIWDHHVAVSMYHEAECDEDPDGGCCVTEESDECCCDHTLAPSVMLYLSIVPSVMDHDITPFYAVLPMRMESFATPSLEDALQRLKDGHQERQVMGSLADVDERMRDIIREQG